MEYKYGAQTRRVTEFAREEYGVEPEFLWPRQSPDYFVLRNPGTKKWFAAVLVIPGKKIGHGDDPKLEIIDLKFDKGQALDFVEHSRFIYPGYHMNKRSWITVPLDGSLPDAAIFPLIERSFRLSSGK